MIKPILASSSALLLSVLLLTSCDKTTEEAPSEEAANVEVDAVAVEAGSLTAAAVVEKSTPESEDVFVSATQAEALTATVVSINPETREAVLVGENGVELSLIVHEDAKNLAQVSPGDTVNAKIVQQVTLQLVKGDNLQAYETTEDRKVEAAEGEMPARAEMIQTVLVYTVEAIDIEANTFKLKDVEGAVKEFTAKNPENLTKAAIGDAVVVTITETTAVEVVKAAE